jgi:IS605 OrfB family transposase
LQAHRKKSEVDLMWVRGKWYPAVVCDVDFGIAIIATDSLSNQHVGAKMEAYQARYAKRRLRQMSGKQKRFQKHENHGISKSIIFVAERSVPSIALEDLKDIRTRVKARKAQRKRLHNESFSQLRICFIAYKIKPAEVLVVAVDPRNTSWECPTYGRIDRCNRKTRSKFRDMACEHGNNAASNIASRAAVIQSMFAHQCAPGAMESCLQLLTKQLLRLCVPQKFLKPPKFC